MQRLAMSIREYLDAKGFVYFHKKKPNSQGSDLVIVIPRAMKHLFDNKRVFVVRDI